MIWITLLRVDSTILSLDFHYWISTPKRSDPLYAWLLKEWVFTPAQLESRSPKVNVFSFYACIFKQILHIQLNRLYRVNKKKMLQQTSMVGAAYLHNAPCARNFSENFCNVALYRACESNHLGSGEYHLIQNIQSSSRWPLERWKVKGYLGSQQKSFSVSSSTPPLQWVELSYIDTTWPLPIAKTYDDLLYVRHQHIKDSSYKFGQNAVYLQKMFSVSRECQRKWDRTLWNSFLLVVLLAARKLMIDFR